ncbi:radial spoke head protein 9 [Leptinotarsa decemlineata]|uniref:radial spoke head protein 9 n=1 Tax=Leptinotarsa decemlineata TaxID=7539 RepID=UPI003D304936
MNLNLVLKSLDSTGHFGHIISVEEGMILHNSLLILQNENHFKQVFFWGKILGSENDYYVAYGYTRDIIYGKVYYYSRNCIDWGLLPQPTKNGSILTPLCTTKFQGDPSLVVDVLIEKDETLVPGKRKQPQLRKLKEEDRLACTVHLIIEEVGVVPRGALFKRPDGVIIENLSFEGISPLEAREITSFLHFRQPTRKYNTNLLTRDDYNYAMDFLDPLDIDIPEGCWIIHVTSSEDMVILKSIYWPGLMFFHYLKTSQHGFVYFGHGKKCLDAPFLLNPFMQL